MLAAAALLLAGASIVAIDGDTIRIDAEKVRVVGVDTPEMRCRCPAECAGAAAALEFTARTLADGAVTVERQGVDRWGRTLAIVRIDGRDLAALLIARGLGRPYAGGRRPGWCSVPGR